MRSQERGWLAVRLNRLVTALQHEYGAGLGSQAGVQRALLHASSAAVGGKPSGQLRRLAAEAAQKQHQKHAYQQHYEQLQQQQVREAQQRQAAAQQAQQRLQQSQLHKQQRQRQQQRFYQPGTAPASNAAALAQAAATLQATAAAAAVQQGGAAAPVLAPLPDSLEMPVLTQEEGQWKLTVRQAYNQLVRWVCQVREDTAVASANQTAATAAAAADHFRQQLTQLKHLGGGLAAQLQNPPPRFRAVRQQGLAMSPLASRQPKGTGSSASATAGTVVTTQARPAATGQALQQVLLAAQQHARGQPHQQQQAQQKASEAQAAWGRKQQAAVNQTMAQALSSLAAHSQQRALPGAQAAAQAAPQQSHVAQQQRQQQQQQQQAGQPKADFIVIE